MKCLIVKFYSPLRRSLQFIEMVFVDDDFQNDAYEIIIKSPSELSVEEFENISFDQYVECLRTILDDY